MHSGTLANRLYSYARIAAVIAAAGALTWLSSTGVEPAHAAPQPDDPPPVTQSDDLDGDDVADTVTSDPDGGDGSGEDAGVVEINSGADGTLVSTIEGKQAGDKFGQSVAIIGPDPAGIRHLLIGAPNDSGAGRAYFFEGPFDGALAAEIPADSAAFKLKSLFSFAADGVPEDHGFGVHAAPLYDITDDDIHELRIGSTGTMARRCAR